MCICVSPQRTCVLWSVEVPRDYLKGKSEVKDRTRELFLGVSLLRSSESEAQGSGH